MKINLTTIKVSKIKYLFSLLLTIVLFYSCNSQQNKYIDTKFEYKQNYASNGEYFKSKELDKLFNVKNGDYFIPDIYGLDTDIYYMKPISIEGNHKKSYILLYDKKDILKDTLSIPHEYSYSINVQLENNKNGICLGKFDEENTFFEITNIYEITNKIKLKPVSIETKILDCPVPVEYNSEENVGIEDYFKYGKLKNNIIKKYSVSAQWHGIYNKTIETEMTTTGMASISYNFTITKNSIYLKTNTYHEPISCNGEYYPVENSNLELYYNGNDNICKLEAPNFIIKKQNERYYIKGLGGEGTINEWIEVKKEN